MPTEFYGLFVDHFFIGFGKSLVIINVPTKSPE